jgi:hypothetical protein
MEPNGPAERSGLKVGDIINVKNPRTKKELPLKVIQLNNENKQMYKCEYKNKTIFIYPHEEIENAYDCLFSINKAIYSGWWNRTLIRVK